MSSELLCMIAISAAMMFGGIGATSSGRDVDSSLRPVVTSLATNRVEPPATTYVKFEEERILKGQWLTKYTVVNTHKSRSITVKATKWAQGELPHDAKYKEREFTTTLEPGESEEWGTYQTTGVSEPFKPKIVKASYASE